MCFSYTHHVAICPKQCFLSTKTDFNSRNCDQILAFRERESLAQYLGGLGEIPIFPASAFFCAAGSPARLPTVEINGHARLGERPATAEPDDDLRRDRQPSSAPFFKAIERPW